MSHCPLYVGTPTLIVLSCVIAHRAEGRVPRYKVTTTDEMEYSSVAEMDNAAEWTSAIGAIGQMIALGASRSSAHNAITIATTNEG